MRFRPLWRGAALLVFFLLLAPRSASADLVYVFGSTLRGPPPANVLDATDTPLYFLEQPSIVGADLYVQITAPAAYGGFGSAGEDPTCTIPLDTSPVASHFVYRMAETTTTVESILVFDAPIAGIATDGVCMDAEGATCEHPSVSYPMLTGLGMGLTTAEDDYLVLFPGRRALYYRFAANAVGDWDGIRIFTEVPSDRASDASLSCRIDGELVDGGMVTVTAQVMTSGPNALPDPQIALRVPNGLVLGAAPPGCVDFAGRGLLCQSSIDPLDAGSVFAVSFGAMVDLDAIGPSSRLYGFASGATHDPNLEDNGCEIVLGGPGPRDGGLPVDGGNVPDGGSTIGTDDGGAPVPPGAPPTFTFAGGGGCGCRTASSPTPPKAPALAAALALALALRRGRRST
jgi:MYXO-CTERM domain-containing protein